MKGKSILTALVATALTSLASADTLLVHWGTLLDTGEKMTSATLNGSVISSACDSKLAFGATDINVNATTEARGTMIVTISGTSHSFDLSDDSICGGYWSPTFAQVKCSIPYPDDEDPVLSPATETMSSCFPSAEGHTDSLLPFNPDEENAADAIDEFGPPEEITETSPNLAASSFTGLSKRQPNCQILRRTRRASTRVPERYRRHVQLIVSTNSPVLSWFT